MERLLQGVGQSLADKNRGDTISTLEHNHPRPAYSRGLCQLELGQTGSHPRIAEDDPQASDKLIWMWLAQAR